MKIHPTQIRQIGIFAKILPPQIHKIGIFAKIVPSYIRNIGTFAKIFPPQIVKLGFSREYFRNRFSRKANNPIFQYILLNSKQKADMQCRKSPHFYPCQKHKKPHSVATFIVQHLNSIINCCFCGLKLYCRQSADSYRLLLRKWLIQENRVHIQTVYTFYTIYYNIQYRNILQTTLVDFFCNSRLKTVGVFSQQCTVLADFFQQPTLLIASGILLKLYVTSWRIVFSAYV